MLDRLDLVLARLALDHLDHVLRVEILQAEADVGAEAHEDLPWGIGAAARHGKG